MERIRKDIIALFKSEGLSITIHTNLIETDFLDVSFNLEIVKFFPYKKPKNIPLYIHSESNYPPSIINKLPSMTNRRNSNLSCNENEFNKAKPLYESALKSSEFNCSMKFAKNLYLLKTQDETEIGKLYGQSMYFKCKDKHRQSISKACKEIFSQVT